MEEKKMRYVYQLSLSDGTVLINESEGLFSLKDPSNTEDKVLINSAVLIKAFEQESEPAAEANVQEVAQEAQPEQAPVEVVEAQLVQ